MKRRGTYDAELSKADEALDPEVLTVGFARRFASYKRGDLLLRDEARLIRMLSNTDRPIQFVFAGKAHPRDTEGKDIIRNIVHFAQNEAVRRRIIFLEDYDIDVARAMVQGVDVWLNNPRRPMEASGTSGMKAAANGVLNLSTLDGWWCEAYQPGNGWSIGAGETYQDPDYHDMIECQAMYEILENEIIPLYYERGADNLPRTWISHMKNCIQQIAPQFNTHRMVADYTSRFYNPAAARWRYLAAEAMTRAKAFSQWKNTMRKSWSEFQIKDVVMEVVGQQSHGELNMAQAQIKAGDEIEARACVALGQVPPEQVSVELYHGTVDTWGNIQDGEAVEMQYDQANGKPGHFWFRTTFPCVKTGQHGVTVRVLPKHPDQVNAYELGLILWESPA
jgi:starch phosphorylase